MKRMLLSLGMLLVGGFVAQAGTGPNAWSCKITAEQMKGSGYTFVLISGSRFKGPGTVTCHSTNGTVDLPVKIKLEAAGLTLGIGVVKDINMHLEGVSVGVADPTDVFDTYFGGGPTVALFNGQLNISLNFEGRKHGVGLGLNLLGSSYDKGFRVAAGVEGWTLTVSPADPQYTEPDPEPYQPTPGY